MSTVTLNIEVDSKGAVRNVKTLDKELDKLEKSTSRTAKKIQTFGRVAAGTMAAGLAIAFKKGAEGAVKFEKSMAEISTLLDGNIAKKTQEMAVGIQKLSAAYGGDLETNAKAAYAIISAGASDSADALKLLEAANRLAIGGVTDVATAADGLTSALNAYGETADAAEGYSDAMFVAMKAGKTTIGELSSVIGTIAPLASGLGVSFDETTAALATLTTTGLSTSQAATYLQAAFTNILKPSKEAADLAADLGIQFNSAALEAQGLSGFLDMVKTATGGSVDQLTKLFGSAEAVKAAMSLAGNQSQVFNDILEQQATKAGATSEAFEKMSGTVSQQWNELTAKTTVLATKLGSELIPAFLVIVDFLSNDVSAAFISARDGLSDFLFAIYELRTKSVKYVKDMVAEIKKYFGNQFDAIMTSVGDKVEAVTEYFAEMYDKVVGNSYVPDMIEGIGYEFGRLDDVMIRPSEDATSETEMIFEEFADNVQESLTELIGDNFKSILEEGKLSFKGFVDSIQDMFFQMVENIIKKWISSKIGSLFGGGASGGIGGIFSGAASSGLGGIGSSIASSAIGKSIFGGVATTSSGGGGGAIGSALLGTSGAASGTLPVTVTALPAGYMTPAVATPLASSAPAATAAAAPTSGAFTTGLNAVAAWAAPVAVAAIAIGGALKSARIDKENAALTDQFNGLRLNTEEFAGELVRVNENLTLVGATADAVYVRHHAQTGENITQTYAYHEALREMGVGMKQIYTEAGDSIMMLTGNVAQVQKVIASGFDQAKLKVKSFTTSATSSFTVMTSKFSGSMNEWKGYLQEAMDSGSLSADAAFNFIEDESGNMKLKLMGDSTEWADFMISSGRLSAEAYSTMFGEIGIAGETTFGALTSDARAFQSALNSIKAPSSATATTATATTATNYGSGYAAPIFDYGSGYATGGSFMVGGSGGTDTTPVSFMATKGEKVTVETPEQQGSQAPIIIEVSGDGGGLENFIRVVSDDHRVQVNRSQVRATERVY